jgi:exonuclease III
MYQPGKLAQIIKGMEIYNLDLLGLSEVGWNGSGQYRTPNGNILLYSGMPNENDVHQHGVSILLSNKLKHSLVEWKPVNERIITARLATKYEKNSVMQCYAPTEEYDLDKKEEFYNLLNNVLDDIDKKDAMILLGDFNAKVGCNNEEVEHIMGTHGIGDRNENGELLIELCGRYNLKI